MRIAKADLVPTEANLLAEYATFAELEVACARFCAEVNARPHRATGRPPVEVLAEERARPHVLHVLPGHPVTVAFGQTRRVGWDCTISVDGVRYSVMHQHVDERVWVRWAGDELVVTAIDPDGATRDPPPLARPARPPTDPRRALPGRTPGSPLAVRRTSCWSFRPCVSRSGRTPAGTAASTGPTRRWSAGSPVMRTSGR